MGKTVLTTVVVGVVAVLAAVTFSKLTDRSSGHKTASGGVQSAIGSIRPGEEISPHFVATIAKVDSHYFKIRITPQANANNVYLHPEGTYMEPMLFDGKGNQVSNDRRPESEQHTAEKPSDFVFTLRRRSPGPAVGPYKSARYDERLFSIDTRKLPAGTYTVSARTEVNEEGPEAKAGKLDSGNIAIVVRGADTVVVP